MRKPKKKTATEKILPARSRSPAPDDIDELDEDELPAAAAVLEPDEDSAAELGAILAELGGATDASISVNKVTLQGEERLGKYMPREFDVDSLRDRYGGGVYWLYFHVGGRLHTKRRVVFAKSLEELRGSEPAAARSIAPADAFAAALDRMATMQRDQFQQLLTVMKPQSAGLAEVVTLAEKMASLSGARSSGGDAVDTLLKGFELARKFGGGDEVSIGGALAELVRALREGPTPMLPATGGPGATTGGDHMQAMIQRALAQQLPVLLRGAQSQSDVGVYAQLIFDQVPEIYLRPMIEFLKKPDWFDLLARADGRVVPYQVWFEALRSEIIRATSPEPAPAA